MGIKLQGGNSSTNLANINSRNELSVVTPQALTGVCAGFAQFSTEVDAGDIIGRRTVVAESSDDYRLRAGVDQTIFNATFEGTTILTTQWNALATTTAAIQNNGFYILNSSVAANMVASGSAVYVRSWRLFPTFGSCPTYLDMWIREAGTNATNAISEWGFLYMTAQAAQQPLDGIYFRRISGGQLKGIITTGISSTVGVDTYEIDLDTAKVPPRDGGDHPFDPNEVNHYLISFHNDIVRFWINDALVGEIQCPAQLAQMPGSSLLPVGFRVVNLNITSEARQLSVGYVNVGLGDQNSNKPWSHAMVGSGGGAYQVQIGGTPGPTVTRGTGALGHPTSGTARIAGSWSSTTNPGLNSLGGLWTSPAISTVLSDTDYPIFAYQNPAGTVTGLSVIPGKTLYVTGIRIGDTSVVTAGGAATSIFLSYIVQVENTVVSTSTVDTATATAGKATVIGGQGFGPSGTDPAGTMKPGFEMTFTTPLVVPAGKYFTVIVRPYGVIALNTLVVTGSVAVNGYFE